MENPQDATDFNGKTLDLWRRFLGIVADFPKETSPQPASPLSIEGLISSNREVESASIPAGSGRGESVAAQAGLDPPEAAAKTDWIPPRPPDSAVPHQMASGLDLPWFPPAEQRIPAPPVPEQDRPGTERNTIPPTVRRYAGQDLLGSMPPRPDHDLVGSPSDGDPYGQNRREREIISHVNRYDTTRAEMVDASYRQAALEHDFRGEQLRVMRRMANDLGGDFRQLLDLSSAYESSRDTLTDAPI